MQSIEFSRCVEEGDILSVQKFLNDTTFNQSISAGEWYSYLIIAVRKGHTEIVGLLLTDPRVNQQELYYNLLEAACASGNLELVKVLIERA